MQRGIKSEYERERERDENYKFNSQSKNIRCSAFSNVSKTNGGAGAAENNKLKIDGQIKESAGVDSLHCGRCVSLLWTANTGQDAIDIIYFKPYEY